MNQKMINYIIQKYQFHSLQVKKDNERLDIENDNYKVSIVFYNDEFVEEMIYDKSKEDIFFYLHHDCLCFYEALLFIEDFLNIAIDIVC